MSSEPFNVTPGDRITAGWANSVVGSIKRRKFGSGRKLQFAGGGSNDICPFGEIFTDTNVTPSVQKIRGGVVFCGDKNFNMEGHPVNVANTRTVFLYIELPVSVNKDDDNQLLLPGIKTSSGNPVFKENPTNYPNNTNPSLPSGDGTIIIPLGKLTVKDGSATFVQTGCGSIRADHCGGNLLSNRV